MRLISPLILRSSRPLIGWLSYLLDVYPIDDGWTETRLFGVWMQYESDWLSDRDDGGRGRLSDQGKEAGIERVA